MAIIVKKGQLEKLNKNISQRRLIQLLNILIASLQLKQKKPLRRFLKKLTMKKRNKFIIDGGGSSTGRTTACGAGGCGFKSRSSPQRH